MLLTLLFSGWRKRAVPRSYRLISIADRGANLALTEGHAAQILPQVLEATSCFSAPEAAARLVVESSPATLIASEVSYV